jgi:DNA-binding GntR family transcriptional regulator
MLKTIDLAEQAYEQLKERIRSGAFSENEAVYEKQLADQLGVSRTPIREAVRMLENEGLVERLTKGGIRAVSITHLDLTIAAQARQALETLIVRWAAEVITEEQLEQLDNLLQRASISLKAQHFDDVFQANEGFHRLLACCTGSRLTSQLVGRIYDYLRPRDLLQRIKNQREVRELLEEVHDEHIKIAAALHSRDALRATRAMADHQDAIAKHYRELVGVTDLKSQTGGSK